MDVKCPSSDMSHKNVLTNLMGLQLNDEVKFVIADETDYLYARKIMASYPTPAKIIFSPMFDKNNKPTVSWELAEWMLRDSLVNVRVQAQLHKVLGVK